MNVRLISIRSVLKEFVDSLYIGEEYNERHILKIAQDIVRRIISDEQYAYRIALFRVHNYKAVITDEGFKKVHEISYREEPTQPCSREELYEFVQHSFDGSGCKLVMQLECPNCQESSCKCDEGIIVDVNSISRRANPKLDVGHAKHFIGQKSTLERGNGCSFHPGFKLMRPATHAYFGLDHHVSGCINMDMGDTAEYRIEFPVITTSFKEGEVLLSYLATPLDEEGYLLIPDHELIFQAIKLGLMEARMERAFITGMGPQERVNWQVLIAEKERIIGRARNELKLPPEHEVVAFFDNHLRKVAPYWGWRRNLNKYQKDQYRPWENK